MVETHVPAGRGRRQAHDAPQISLLAEDNARQGFFEREQFHSVMRHLPEELRPVVQFAYITGWRAKSEVITLEWRQIDLKAGEIRLEPGTTKNKAGRTFPFTIELRTLLEAQHAEHERLKKQGVVVPWVFYRMVAEGRRGKKKPQPITSFIKAFKTACRKAGCPGRLPHDMRRSAVRNLVRAGVPQSVAMKLTGHKTDSVFGATTSCRLMTCESPSNGWTPGRRRPHGCG